VVIDNEICLEILKAVASKDKPPKIKVLAEQLEYDHDIAKINAEHLIGIGYLNRRLGGYLYITPKGRAFIKTRESD
jgi:predicted transcriptional regulator